jgi:hypothetical protein
LSGDSPDFLGIPMKKNPGTHPMVGESHRSVDNFL